MDVKAKTLEDTAMRLGAHKAAVIPVEDIVFDRSFRQMCEANSCGKYGTCWMCPPDVGGIDEMMERAKGYENAFVFQTVGQLEDSFDIEGMEEAASLHNKITLAVVDEVVPQMDRALVMGAGACQVCETCAKREGVPCRFPDRAIPSLEAHGIAVSQLATASGMKYINGQNTVTYFSAVLFGA